MTSQEAYTSVTRGRSRRDVKKIEREQQRKRREVDAIEKREAVTEYLLTLDKANSSVSLSSVLEIVYPKTTFGRLVSIQKNRMIPAKISHIDGKSTLGGWMDYRKVTGQYLQVEQAVGYVVPSENDENPHFLYDDVILQDGRIGTLLKPKNTGGRNYSFGEESVSLDYYGDVFENRNCQAVWGPSLTNPDQLGVYQARKATQDLGKLIVGLQE